MKRNNNFGFNFKKSMVVLVVAIFTVVGVGQVWAEDKQDSKKEEVADKKVAVVQNVWSARCQIGQNCTDDEMRGAVEAALATCFKKTVVCVGTASGGKESSRRAKIDAQLAVARKQACQTLVREKKGTVIETSTLAPYAVPGQHGIEVLCAQATVPGQVPATGPQGPAGHDGIPGDSPKQETRINPKTLVKEFRWVYPNSVLPPTTWSPIAVKGDKGERGDPGPGGEVFLLTGGILEWPHVPGTGELAFGLGFQIPLNRSLMTLATRLMLSMAWENLPDEELGRFDGLNMGGRAQVSLRFNFGRLHLGPVVQIHGVWSDDFKATLANGGGAGFEVGYTLVPKWLRTFATATGDLEGRKGRGLSVLFTGALFLEVPLVGWGDLDGVKKNDSAGQKSQYLVGRPDAPAPWPPPCTRRHVEGGSAEEVRVETPASQPASMPTSQPSAFDIDVERGATAKCTCNPDGTVSPSRLCNKHKDKCKQRALQSQEDDSEE